AARVVDGDQTAFAAEARETLVDDFIRGRLHVEAGVLHQRGNVPGGRRTEKHLTVPRAGDRARSVARERAGADDGRVSDAAERLVGHAPRGGRRGKIAVRIEGGGADRPRVARPR